MVVAGKGLSYDRQLEILTKIAGLADRGKQCIEHLHEQGFSAFDARREFIAGFCEGEDLPLHERCDLEEAKAHIATPDGHTGLLTGGRSNGYASPALDDLRRARDEANGVPYSQIAQNELWKREIDPCLRNLERLELQGSPLVSQAREQMQSALARHREIEISRHAASALSRQDDNPEHVVALIAEVLESELRVLGFRRDEKRSKAYLPVVSKPLTDDWDICWSPLDERNLRRLPKTGWAGVPLAASCDLACYLRAKGRRGPVFVPFAFQSLDIVMLRIGWIVHGFDWAYSRFADCRELEVIVKAYSALYRFLADDLESILLQEFHSHRN